MGRKYIPVESEDQKRKKKKEKHYEKEVLKDLDDLLGDFERKVLERRSVVSPHSKIISKYHGSIIPSEESYSVPEMKDSERIRFEELKDIVLNIENAGSVGSESVRGEIEDRYTALLNERQFDAVFTLDGPVLVIAGAGSGKTRTIVHRVAYMIEKGISPGSILLLTFTKKAANEMTARVNTLTGSLYASKITAGTFHSFANMMLRVYGHIAGIDRNFTICDQQDAADIVDLVKNELDIKKQKKPFPKKGTVAEIISRSRNRNEAISSVIDSQYFKYSEFTEDILKIAERYDSFKKEKNIFDYDDLLERFLHSLKNSPQFLSKIEKRYRYIMVDEYQDTNIVQGEIADIIASSSGNIMVVGDDIQSIYGFRGAAFENILRFPKRWTDCKVVKLEQNYRSRKPLLYFTNAIVDNCYAAYKKVLFSKMGGGSKPLVKRAVDAEDEAVYIAEIIKKEMEKIPAGQFAVLYRSSHHGNFVQVELLKRNIDFVVYGGIKFMERRHIKDMMSYAKVIQNPADAVALHRVLKLIPGIGSGTAGKIVGSISENGFKTIGELEKKRYFNDLIKMFKMLSNAGKEGNPSNSLEKISDYYLPVLKSVESDYEDRIKDISVLLQIASGYKTLEKFLSDFSLDPPSSQLNTSRIPIAGELPEDKVVLSTVHSAKGLEWHTVFVMHLLDGCFPSDRSLTKMEDLEEERRLFYVACSRAKERLFLTFPSAVSFYNGTMFLPSRFLAEIDKENYEIEV